MSSHALSHPPHPVILVDDDGALAARVLPARGLDIGEVSFDGLLLSWAPLGGVPETPAAEGPDRWRASFGGLVATCGLHNVGLPSEGHGQHGAFTLTAAADVSVVREHGITTVTGVVADGDLVCQRTITVTTDTLAIVDVVTNTATSDRQAPILYHVNFGAPFLGPDLVVEGAVETSIPRDPGPPVDWRRPARNEVLDDFVVEHRLTSGAPRLLTLTDAVRRLRVTVSWTGLDRVHQWIDLTPGKYVTAIEPANSSVQGREFDRAAGRAPVLRAGESRTTGVTVHAEQMPA
ncbi:DUF4432 family protein [Herbiconiux ginsengi]|uniref:Galactose mutarotase n=1 Tax=Herbiconiux ginsengi TaxID=381665 RepID=A0A1H3NEE8_9MICO|nr:DUF4432 family protein [Herbiconiux ginsengi]SDY87311.1 protein of unknown function [Herbiconiux ginsengi]